MIHIAKHKIYAIGIYLLVTCFIYLVDGSERATQAIVILGIFLVFILFAEFIAWLSSWGMPEALASDHGTPLSPDLVAIFLWAVFLIASMFLIFGWSLY
ncbi:MAG: hypothetical protein KTR18_01480 [Acidiferrobacterales bacterium]|nr:hypothetical protein [Acidiferrobacterales bacterium]